MTIQVTTIRGGTADLRPCPPFCTGRHFRPGDPPWPGDGFFHHGQGTGVHAVDHGFGTDAAFCVYPEAWVPHLTDVPEPAGVGLDVRLRDGDAVMSMTPAQARAFTTVLDATWQPADNRTMSVTAQAANPDSALCRFLDTRLPQSRLRLGRHRPSRGLRHR